MVTMRIKLMSRTGLHSNCSFECSISRIRPVFGGKEIDNVVTNSNIWWRGRSYAASVASDVPEPQKHRKRVPKDDRRALIESFVEKYKAINAGKFPSVSHTKKQVGGSFYVVRNILQELQSKSRMPSLESRGEKSSQEKANSANNNILDISSADNEQLEATSDQKMFEKTLSDDDVKLASLVRQSIISTRRNLQEKYSEEASSASHKEQDTDHKDGMASSEFFYAESHMLKNEQEVVSDACMESKSLSEGFKHEGLPNREDEQVHSSLGLDSEKTDSRVAKDAEVPSRSKGWGHVKSIVDGIIRMWRNR